MGKHAERGPQTPNALQEFKILLRAINRTYTFEDLLSLLLGPEPSTFSDKELRGIYFKLHQEDKKMAGRVFRALKDNIRKKQFKNGSGEVKVSLGPLNIFEAVSMSDDELLQIEGINTMTLEFFRQLFPPSR